MKVAGKKIKFFLQLLKLGVKYLVKFTSYLFILGSKC